MPEKNIKSRIVHKHDIEANWLKATNFIPKQGEIIVYDADEKYLYERFKIGDGTTLVSDLPFSTSQPDWNQNDPTKADYVKNRTHWIDFTNEIQPAIEVTPFFNAELEIPMGELGNFYLTVGKKYKVVFDGKEYICEAIMATMEGQSAPAIGNTLVAGGADTGDPFAIFRIATDSSAYSIFFDMDPHIIQIFEEVPHKISNKFIPTLEEMRTEEVVIIPETELSGTESDDMTVSFMLETVFSYTVGSTYRIMWNGVEYTCVAVDLGGIGAIGNLSAAGISGGNSDAPFISANEGGTLVFVGLDGSTTLIVSVAEVKPVKIPTKFVPTLEEMRTLDGDVIFETTFDVGEDNQAIGALNSTENLVPGEFYKVTFNGEEHVCKALGINDVPPEVAAEFPNSAAALGNIESMLGTGDTGEPFVFLALPSDGAYMLVVLDGSTVGTLTVSRVNVIKIPNKFIDAEWMAASVSTTLFEQTVSLPSSVQNTISDINFAFEASRVYEIYWNGIKYICTAKDIEGIVYVGNLEKMVGFGDTGEPFVITASGNAMNVYRVNREDKSVDLKIVKVVLEKLPDKYLSDSILNKMDKKNPTGTGSFSINRKSGSIVGDGSFAAGSNVIASGEFSHAEGNHTTASGAYAHAEGYVTNALEHGSHAEGSYTVAGGYQSHAEGVSSYGTFTISGDANATTYTFENDAVVEAIFVTYNDVTAKVISVDTVNKTITLDKTLSTTAIVGVANASYRTGGAIGRASHTEGCSTIAKGDYSHAQGKFNVADSANKYAHIVGNGDSTARSNAHTLDWDGNAWFQGDIYIGSTSGTNKDEGSVKLASEAYVDNALAVITIPELDAICVIPLEAGLYEDGAMTMSWDELVDSGLVYIYGGANLSAMNEELVGEIIISDSITCILSLISTNLTRVVIPNSVTECQDEAFMDCTSLTEVVLSENMTTLPNRLFVGCTSLEEFNIPSTITSIGPQVFSGCTKLSKVTIPNTITRISGKAFENCSSLSNITIPKSIAYIDDFAFQNCTALNNITFEGTTTEWQNINLGFRWNQNVPATQVVCSNGTITL